MVTEKDSIRTEGLSYSYKNQDLAPVSALRGLDITIKRGEFVAVVGHNGSGKSTFAKHLNAILTPDMGRVLVWGMDTREEDLLYDIRRSTGMVFQNPDNQIVATVVEEDVAFAPENLGVPPAEIRRRVDDALEAVGMTKFKKTRDLSALRRTKATRCDCGHYCNATGLHCAGRADCYARPGRTA